MRVIADILAFMRKKISWYGIAVIFVGLLIGAYLYFTLDRLKDLEIEVKKGSISEEVIVTGKTKSSNEISLGFEVGGKIKSAPAFVGKKVLPEEVLLLLEDGDLLAGVLDAKAVLSGERVKLEELKKGKRPEEIKIQEGKIQSASVSLLESVRNVSDKIGDAYTKSDDAIRNKADQLFSNARTSSPVFNFPVTNYQLRIDIESLRPAVERELNTWLTETNSLNVDKTSSGELTIFITNAKERLSLFKDFLSKTGLAINYLTPTATLTQTIIDGYKADISSARSNVDTAIINLSTAEEKWKSAKSSLTLEENQFLLDKAGTSEEKISTQEALISSAEAKLLSAEAKLKKAHLRSPLSGFVTKQEGQVGEIVSAGQELVSIMSLSNFEIEANIPEVDIGKINVGNPVHLTFDAFSGEIFSGKVIFIDPAETIIDGVVNFKIKVSIEGDVGKLKSGLTSNLSIETRKVDDVLVLPQYAILEKDSGSYVRKSVDGKTEEVKVTLGLRGSDGNVEIVSGLSVGDKVMNIGLKNK